MSGRLVGSGDAAEKGGDTFTYSSVGFRLLVGGRESGYMLEEAVGTERVCESG